MMDERGEITTSTVVKLIILMLGFFLIVFLISQFNWTGQISDETCHQSVVYRGSLPSTAGVNNYVPLKCKTNKICITSGFIGGNCEEFKGMSGIAKVKVTDIHQVEKVIADNIIKCWSKMGEGKISVFSQWLAQNYGVGRTYSSCVICDRVAFDKESLTAKGIDLSKMNVEVYMSTRLMPDKNVTYSQFLNLENGLFSAAPIKVAGQSSMIEGDYIVTKDANGNELSRSLLFNEAVVLDRYMQRIKMGLAKNQIINREVIEGVDSIAIRDASKNNELVYNKTISEIMKEQKEEFNKVIEEIKKDPQFNSDKIKPILNNDAGNELAIMFMQINAPKFIDVQANTWTAILYGEIGSVALSHDVSPILRYTIDSCKKVYQDPSVDFTSPVGIALGLVKYGKCFALITALEATQVVSVQSSQYVAGGVCKDVVKAADPSSGCSVVRSLPYNEDNLKTYCDVIESIP
jgi:hypothetical protein